MTEAWCAVCGSSDLRLHLRVRGDMGEEGLIPTTDRFGTALADIARCAACGHMQLDPMPSAEMLSAAYTDAASLDYVDEEAGQRATARLALERIERQVPGRGTLLDLGCWVGYLLAEARERGWATIGVEPSRFASNFARASLGLDVRCGELLSEPLPEASFQAVTMGDLIEHLTDPGAALRRARSLLAPDGVLWLTLPDAGSLLARILGRRWWSVIPTHVQYFTRASITRVLEREGFRVLEILTAPKAFTVGYYLERIGGYSPSLGEALVRGAAALGADRRIWAPDFRDRMAVLASPRQAVSARDGAPDREASVEAVSTQPAPGR